MTSNTMPQNETEKKPSWFTIHDADGIYQVVSAGGGIIAYPTTHYPITLSQHKANAYLIAAAPDMLEALEQVKEELCFIYDEYPLDNLILTVKEAIAKAKAEGK